MSKFIRDIKLDSREDKINKIESIIPDIKLDNILEQFTENISNIRSKFKIYETLIKDGYEKESKDILRSQVVFLMSTLDFYMHEIAKYCLLQIFKGEKQRTNSYKDFIVSIEVVERALKNPESVDWLSEEIIHRHSHKTFMSSNEIKKVLSLVSTKKIYKNIETELNMEGQLSDKIKEIYERRNKIAHQADRDHTTKKLYEINKEMVESYIDIIENMVKVIQNNLISDI